MYERGGGRLLSNSPAIDLPTFRISDHNRVHAADVLHSCFYLTVHPVRAFLGSSDDFDNSAFGGGGELDDEDDESLGFGGLDSTPQPIARSMASLELMALYTAAAMHDFDHPGGRR